MNKNTIIKLSEQDMSTVTSNLLHGLQNTELKQDELNTRSNKQSLSNDDRFNEFHHTQF